MRVLLVEDDALLGVASGRDSGKPGSKSSGSATVIRRARGEAALTLRRGDLELDPAAHRVVFRGRVVELSPREFTLLHELMLNAGRVLSREQLEERLYPWGREIESNAVEVHVHHLRRKLAPRLIRTIRGVGYLMPGEADAAKPGRLP
jgi:two-component system OmpR family response regulator/two-component system response regulator QseB